MQSLQGPSLLPVLRVVSEELTRTLPTAERKENAIPKATTAHSFSNFDFPPLRSHCAIGPNPHLKRTVSRAAKVDVSQPKPDSSGSPSSGVDRPEAKGDALDKDRQMQDRKRLPDPPSVQTILGSDRKRLPDPPNIQTILDSVFYVRCVPGGNDDLTLRRIIEMARNDGLERLGPFGPLRLNARPWCELDDLDLYDRYKRNMLMAKYGSMELQGVTRTRRDRRGKDHVLFWTLQTQIFFPREDGITPLTPEMASTVLGVYDRLRRFLPLNTYEGKQIAALPLPPNPLDHEWVNHLGRIVGRPYLLDLSLCVNAFDIVHTEDLVRFLCQYDPGSNMRRRNGHPQQ